MRLLTTAPCALQTCCLKDLPINGLQMMRVVVGDHRRQLFATADYHAMTKNGASVANIVSVAAVAGRR